MVPCSGFRFSLDLLHNLEDAAAATVVACGHTATGFRFYGVRGESEDVAVSFQDGAPRESSEASFAGLLGCTSSLTRCEVSCFFACVLRAAHTLFW